MTTAATPIVESRVVLGGTPTRVLEVPGAGPPILLLHGFTDSADSWRPLLAEFAAMGRRAVAVDLPGSGWAPPLGRPPLQMLAAFTASLVERYADSPAVLVGNSLGGRAALRAAQYDDLPLAGVVGIGAAGLAYTPHLESVERWSRRLYPLSRLLQLLPVPRSLLQRAMQRLYDQRLAEGRGDPILGRMYASHWRGMRDVRRLWGDLLALSDEDTADPLDLAAISVPVLLIWGRGDRLAAVEGAQLILDAVVDAELVVLDDCGHCPQVQEPAEVAALIARFAAPSADSPASRRQS